MFFWIYILQILLFLWLYFLSISLGGDTYHTPLPPPWHWWMAPGLSPQRHCSISHGHTQIVGRAPVSQPAKTWARLGAPACLRPSRIQQTLSFSSHFFLHPQGKNIVGFQICAVKSCMHTTSQTHGTVLYLIVTLLWVLSQLYYPVSPKGGTVAHQFCHFMWTKNRRQDEEVNV